MSITAYDEFKKLCYHGTTYAVILHDNMNLLVIGEDEQADSDGFYLCQWIVYEGRTIYGVVESEDYTIRFNPNRNEIRMDWKSEAA